ncbi:response regulator [Anaerosporobacter faecicola]|uniref:response regulator n=1 Tax=Anaerosporobacter faecicola TaxID=2718714 RepID=UPI00143B6EA8|nr:response regulator [Anaerosporobacter faecicola]
MSKTILVIDDSPFITSQITELTQEHDYKVIGHAVNGEEGIQLFTEMKPDLTILDIVMPGIDGMETAAVLLKEKPNAKILMLSSICDSETIEEVKSLGLKYLIPKPIEPDVLLATMEMLMKNDHSKIS